MFMAMAFAMPASAVDWLFDPYVGGTATYTDNVNQSPTNEESSMILSLTPGFTLRSEGSRRVQATMQYGLSGVARFGGDDSGDLYHNLSATGQAELIEDFLFIDGNARVSQEIISLQGSQADALINDSNRTTAGSYSISPYIKKRFGSFADAQARYTLSGTLFGEDALSDLLTNAFSASLDSGTRFNTLTWGLDYSYRDVAGQNTATGDTSYSYERADLSLGYALSRTFRLIGSFGHEWVEYQSVAAAANDRDDSNWSAGFSWSPSRRTSFEATMGERFNGETYYVSAQHRARTSTWNLSYAEDFSDISQATLTEGTVYYYLCGSEFVATQFQIPPDSSCIYLGSQTGLIPSLAEGLYISKTMRAGVSWGISKITYSINAYDVQRYFVRDGSEDRSQGITGAMNYRFAANTTFNGSLALIRNQEPSNIPGLGINQEDDILTLTAGLGHQLGPRTSSALTFRRTQRDSNIPTAEYTENNLTASFNMSF